MAIKDQQSTIKSLITTAVIGATIALGFTACSTEEKEQQLRPVRTMTLKAANAISSHTFNGIARSDVAARLSFNVSGRLKSVNVKPGQYVKKGSLVAEVDDAYFKLKGKQPKVPEQIDYYDEDQELVRSILFGDVRKINGRDVPLLLTVMPLNKPGEQTILQYNELDFNVPIDKDFFNLRSLKQR